MWREIRARKRAAITNLPGRLLTMQLDVSDLHYALGFSTKEVQQIQGFHSPSIMIVIDEANGFPEELFEPIDGLLSGGEKKLFLMIGNPINPIGRFFNSFSDIDTYTHTISCLGHPNVVSGRNIIPGAVTKDWVDKQRKLWGENSSFWQSRVTGQFPKIATDVIINLAWVEEAELIIFKRNEKDVVYMGLDVGEYGSDPCVWVIGNRKGIIRTHERVNIELMECVGITNSFIKEYKLNPRNVGVDSIGIGSGVSSRLRELGQNISMFKSSERAIDSKTFKDKVSEAWWNTRQLLKTDHDSYIPYSFNGKRDQLKSDLCTRKYRIESDGRIKLEDKAVYRKRMKRSPNYGDAFSICYHFLASSSVYGFVSLGQAY